MDLQELQENWFYSVHTLRCSLKNMNQIKGKICMLSYHEAQVCKVDSNIIRIISTFSSQKLFDYLRMAYFSKSLHKVLQNTMK